MAGAIINSLRLTRAGLVLAQYGVRFVPPGTPVPLPLRLARILTAPIGWLGAPRRARSAQQSRLADALTSLGPSYIKLGQFLATRADVIGSELAGELALLQDNLPPFSMAEARRAVEEALGGRLEDHFAEFGPAVAAASIAQVHKAAVIDADGRRREVAV
jgi:ubiquinone biosynthesis protein